MKKLTFTIYSILLLLISCSSPEDPVNNNLQTDDYYITLTVNIAGTSNTKATSTDIDDTETNTLTGTPAENELKSADIYFYNEEAPNFIRFSLTSPQSSEGKYKLSSVISDEQLRALAGKEWSVYIVGNATEAINHYLLSESPTDARLSSLNLPSIQDFGQAGKTMPLVSAKEFIVDFSDIKSDTGDEEEILGKINNLFDGGNVLDLSYGNDNFQGRGIINLERAVARIDYKDYDRNEGELSGYSPYVYPIRNKTVANDLTTEIHGYTWKLHSLKVFNVNPGTYLFRHTAIGDDEKAKEMYELFGKEGEMPDGYNWIAGSDWKYESEGYSKTVTFDNALFITDGIIVEGQDGGIEISELFSTESGKQRITQNGYTPWIYVNENTIPSTLLMNDENLPLTATGVAFTFQVCSDKIGTPVEGTSGSNLTLTMTDKMYSEIEYDTDKEGYFVTFIAYIYHNSDGSENDNPMKYGIVRNNVYQLSVKSINVLPGASEPDNTALTLNVKVLPWNYKYTEWDEDANWRW